MIYINEGNSLEIIFVTNKTVKNNLYYQIDKKEIKPKRYKIMYLFCE